MHLHIVHMLRSWLASLAFSWLAPPPRLAEEEEAKRQAAEAKRQREADKKLLKKERQRLRALVESGGVAAASGQQGGARLLDEDDTEKLCQGLDTAALAALSDAAGADGLSWEQRRAVLLAKLEEMRSVEEAAAEERERQKREASESLKVGRAPGISA